MSQDRHRQPSLSAKAAAAFRRAARKVVQRAKQTGTPIVVWKDGRVREVPIDQVESVTDREATAKARRHA